MQPHTSADYTISPPWSEEPDPHWDVAFGCYGDGYLEWVTTRYFWEPEADRIVADTRRLWEMQHDLDAAEQERGSRRRRRRRGDAGSTPEERLHARRQPA